MYTEYLFVKIPDDDFDQQHAYDKFLLMFTM